MINYKTFDYDLISGDWLSLDNLEPLTGYQIPGQLQYLLDHHIDTDLD
ncbi:MAG: hypothetical protein R2825_03450 [Saprospiraceae bacterium]